MSDSGTPEETNPDPSQKPSPVDASNANIMGQMEPGPASMPDDNLDATAPSDAEEPDTDVTDHQATPSEMGQPADQQMAESDMSASQEESDKTAEVQPDIDSRQDDEIDTEPQPDDETQPPSSPERIRSSSSMTDITHEKPDRDLDEEGAATTEAPFRASPEAEEDNIRVCKFCSPQAHPDHPFEPPHRISDSAETTVVSLNDPDDEAESGRDDAERADQGSASSECDFQDFDPEHDIATGRRVTEPDQRSIETPSPRASKEPDRGDSPSIQEPEAPPARARRRGRRFAHLRSSYSPRAFSAREPERPRRPDAPLQIKKWTKAVLAHRSLTAASTHLLEEVLHELHERRKELAASRRFKEGAKVQSAIEYLIAFHLSREKEEVQEAALTDYQKQVHVTEEEGRAYDSETKRLIKELTHKQKTKRQGLVERHRRDRLELNAQWDSRRNERMYNSPSYWVTALRHQETLLAAQHRLDEANDVSTAIQKHVRDELRHRSKIRQEDYDQSLAKLKVKQQAEIEFFDEHAKLQIEQLKQQRATQRRTVENKVKKVEARGELVNDADRCWNAGFMHRKDLAATGRLFGAALPSSHLNQHELERQETGFLQLPPLDVEVDGKSARKSRRRRRPKEG
jgi:hypothetical protein